jgi:hypothetical protein
MGPLDINGAADNASVAVPAPPPAPPTRPPARGRWGADRAEPPPSFLPRIVGVVGNEVVIEYPGGGQASLPRNSTYVEVRRNHPLGALEGALAGLALGAAAGAVASASPQCASGGDCGAGVAVTAVVTGIVGALWGAAVGHKTTYVFAPSPP